MTNFKLTYFNLRGIAEPIRLMFHYSGVPFEDNEIDAATWPEVKRDFKWQQVPYLEFEGKTLTQSTAILNFLGRRFNLMPEDSLKQAKCDEIIGAVNDLRQNLKPFIIAKLFENNQVRADELLENLTSTVSLFLGNIQDILKETRKANSKTDFILGGNKPVAADFCLAHFTELWEAVINPNLLDKYELLKKQQIALLSVPELTEYITKRPKYIL